jgi:hypothetical protein
MVILLVLYWATIAGFILVVLLMPKLPLVDLGFSKAVI